MKTIFNFTISILVLLFSIQVNGNTALSQGENHTSTVTGKDVITILCTPGLAPAASAWAEAYKSSNPLPEIRIYAEGSLEAARVEASIRIMAETGESGSGFQVNIARDMIVPVMNAANPETRTLLQNGITSSGLREILLHGVNPDWNGSRSAIRFYYVSNEQVLSSLSQYCGVAENEISGVGAATTAEMIARIKAEPGAIGFCNFSELIHELPSFPTRELQFLPVDKNSNGRIDYFEQIFNTADDFLRGVWIGKYPHALTFKVVAQMDKENTGDAEKSFISWIQTGGQELTASVGLCNLSVAELQIAKGITDVPGVVPVATSAKNDSFWFLFIGSILVAGVLLTGLSLIVQHRRRKVSALKDQKEDLISEKALKVPKGLHYDKSHTWSFMEQDGTVRMGIDDFLQHITGSITKVKMKEAGESIRKGEKILTLVREGKQLVIYSPVSGVIKACNEVLMDDASTINSSPYHKGWVYAIEPINWSRESGFMFMADAYHEWLKKEFARMRDFFSSRSVSGMLQPSMQIVQDGGEIADHVLANLGPEVWEDFQTEFLDSSK